MRWPALGVVLVASLAAARAQSPAPAVTTPGVAVQQTVNVTADRGLLGVDDAASSVAVVSREELEREPGLTLDDALHNQAGFQLFRRTSSWTANPTSQGVSLRGLGSTAASRTLVVSDQVPLNDPFGGWVHWNELPPLAIDAVGLLRGGAADLYGSSAIGGVIEVKPAAAGRSLQFAADASGATEDAALEDALLAGSVSGLSLLAAGSALNTGGYIPTAPAFRGTVDVPSNVASRSGRAVLGSARPLGGVRGFLLGNVLQESRSNGTPLQRNGTHLWRYVGGLDAESKAATGSLRLYGSRETYDQSFSAIAANRDAETLTRLQRVPLNDLGASVQGSNAFRHSVVAALGLDVHDTRATDDESTVKLGAVASTTSTSARQREAGGFVDAIAQPGPWSVSGSLRVDSFRTFDVQRSISPGSGVSALPSLSELFVSPHLGLVRRLQHGAGLTATAFRAFRAPTMNELYRTGQVGQQTTLANDALLAERATGVEFGAYQQGRAGHLRGSYFWTEVNRPVSAVLLTQTATSQTLQRQNLGQIRSRGLMLEAQTTRWRFLDAGLGYQLALGTVTAFNASSALQSNLTGKWIPEVPRQSVTANLNYVNPKVANVHLMASYAGQEFDDAANQFVLHPFARFDVSMERALPGRVSLFAGVQNFLDRSIEAGRTPVLTLASPRLVQAGLRYRFSR